MGILVVINNPNSMLVLNKSRRLPDGYRPPDLVIRKCATLVKAHQEKKKMRKEGEGA